MQNDRLFVCFVRHHANTIKHAVNLLCAVSEQHWHSDAAILKLYCTVCSANTDPVKDKGKHLTVLRNSFSSNYNTSEQDNCSDV